MYQQEPSYWRHPVEDFEPSADASCSNVAAATARLLDMVVGENHKPTDRGPVHDLEPSFRRFLALLWLLDPVRYFDGRSETQVARSLGCTRAAFSRLVCELSKRLGIRNRGMKREGAAGVYSARQRRIWHERRQARVDAQLWMDV